MKKILPIIAVFGTSTLLVGCGTQANINPTNNLDQNIATFKESVENYDNVTDEKVIKTSLNNYTLTLSAPELVDFDREIKQETIETETMNEQTEMSVESENIETSSIENIGQISENQEEAETSNIQNTENETTKQISTLYSISNDIESSCDEFCDLKEDLTEAILETQNLISKVKNNEIELTGEERMLLSEQSAQLKSLARQLSNATTELSIHLSDLYQTMQANTENIDNISLKYLIVLDNLVNGNEMLQNGLNSLNLMNQMMYLRGGNLPPNNHGRVLYGFRKNNEEPIIKDYYINENGEMVENNVNEPANEQTSEVNQTETKKTNIDTYKNNKLVSNIDTYKNEYSNIDTFFNTALLDNEFMYGSRGYGYGPNMGAYGYGAYPYNQYVNQNEVNQNTTHGDKNANNTQNIETATEKPKEKKPRRFTFKKNIDSYRNEQTPPLSIRFANIKNSVANFFNKFAKNDKEDVKNTIYRSENTN